MPSLTIRGLGSHFYGLALVAFGATALGCSDEPSATSAGSVGSTSSTTATAGPGGGSSSSTGEMAGAGGLGGAGGAGMGGAGQGGAGQGGTGMGGAGQGGSGAMAKADFHLLDVNPNSATYDQLVSPRDYLMRVSAFYFGHAT